MAELDTRRHPFHVAIENWQHDLNIGTVVRTANAFNAAGVHIVGRRRYNRRGAMVTDRYLHVHHHPGVGDLVSVGGRRRACRSSAVDIVPGAVPLESAELPRALRAALRAGGAGALRRGLRRGVPWSARSPSTARPGRSTSGVAAGIAMHTWIRQHAGSPPPST